ncbi:hypothetical protein Ccrd_015367 [Cynara cardunculus var. scolymus]|uniref:Uncharacterized protein n=1 Tax=Cynara cardunculus var. scolymus TaxID=59895 RepID=A0A103YC08_CYNCS|nr:hypothetical protein Ccrd_015367 [Cynara cardunculus var. scolymus]
MVARSDSVRWTTSFIMSAAILEFLLWTILSHLDALVTNYGDKDFAAVVEECHRVSPDVKIRVVLFPVVSLKTISLVSSADSLVDFLVSSSLQDPMVANMSQKERNNV